MVERLAYEFGNLCLETIDRCKNTTGFRGVRGTCDFDILCCVSSLRANHPGARDSVVRIEREPKICNHQPLHRAHSLLLKRLFLSISWLRCCGEKGGRACLLACLPSARLLYPHFGNRCEPSIPPPPALEVRMVMLG